MIKVNLLGATKKRSARPGIKIPMPTTAVPLVLVLIIVAAGAFGYLWYSDRAAQLEDLDSRIKSATAQKAALDVVIQRGKIFEAKVITLQDNIKVINRLKRNQVNPVLALDVLSEAIAKTQYVWLSSLDQNEGILSMSGTGSSLNAIADFFQNLDLTGYFRNMELNNATDSAGNFTFSLKAEFAPPVPRSAAEAGGN